MDILVLIPSECKNLLMMDLQEVWTGKDMKFLICGFLEKEIPMLVYLDSQQGQQFKMSY
jgi:hypothetical protein